jgi:hypothetical protein
MPHARDHRDRGARDRGARDRGARDRGARDRRTQFVVVLVAIVAGLVAGALGSPRDPSLASAGPDGSSPTTAAPVQAAEVLLLAHVGPDGGADLVVLVGLEEGGGDAAVLMIPTATLVEVPALGLQPLADAVRLSGASSLETTVENALGVAVDRALVLGDARLAELLAPTEEIAVTFRREVSTEDAGGVLDFRTGEQTISAGQAVRLLVARDPDGELAHLVTVQAVLDGWRDALRDQRTAEATVVAFPRSAAIVRAARADVRYESLPVERVSSGGDERYSLRRDAAAALAERLFGWALLGVAGERPRVEVLNGTGAVGLAQAVAQVLVPAGAEITLSGNVPGFGVGETVVVYYRDDGLDPARALVEALGVGRVAKGDAPISVVDLTVVVGADFTVPEG